MDINVASSNKYMKTTAGIASIAKFITFAQNTTDYKDNNIITTVAQLGEQLLNMKDDFKGSEELYEKIVIQDATSSKQGRNCHIAIENMNMDTFTKFFKRHIETKLHLLNTNPTRLVEAAGATFTDHVDQLIDILEKINCVLPTFSVDYNVVPESTDTNRYYTFMHDTVNNCFYEVIDGSMYIATPQKLYEFAEQQKAFFEKINVKSHNKN